MRGRTRRSLALGLAIVSGIGCALVSVDYVGAYTIITRDGHRIEVKAKPEVRGLQAFMRLEPRGQLAVIQEELIDWDRTAAANSEPGSLSVQEGATLVEGRPAPPAPKSPVDVKIVGGRAKEEAQETAAAEPVASPVASQEAVVALQKEHAKLSTLRDEAAGQRKSLEEQIARLQSGQTAYAGDDNPTARELRDLQDRLREVASAIEKYEIRMNDIRSEAAALGGSID